MGLFDLFRSKNKEDRPKVSPVTKWAPLAGERRAQNYDRQEALGALAELCGPPKEGPEGEEADKLRGEAAAALLRRFTFNMDPSITDQEEKDTARNGVLNAGKLAIEPIRTFAAKAESLAWPMKLLKELVEEDEYVSELVLWLSKWDTEYSKFIDPKLQLLAALEEFKHAKIREAVERFLLDVNETARFHAVAATLAQAEEAAALPLVSTLIDEESFRIKNKIAEGFVTYGWPAPEAQREDFRKALPSGFTLDAQGHVVKR